MDRIHTSGHRFMDQAGRQRIFHGLNLVCKGDRQPDGSINYIGPWQEGDFRALAGWGFNVVRLGLIWDAVEPQPGVYDEQTLHGATDLPSEECSQEQDRYAENQLQAHMKPPPAVFGGTYGGPQSGATTPRTAYRNPQTKKGVPMAHPST